MALKPQSLIVSVGTILNIEPLNLISSWFEKIKILNFGNPIEENILNKLFPFKILDNQIQKSFSKYLNNFDPSIKDVEFIEDPIDKIGIRNDIGFIEEVNNIKVFSIHEDQQGNKYKIAFEEESSGLKKIAALFFV